jgi:hypothetical protein
MAGRDGGPAGMPGPGVNLPRTSHLPGIYLPLDPELPAAEACDLAGWQRPAPQGPACLPILEGRPFS